MKTQVKLSAAALLLTACYPAGQSPAPQAAPASASGEGRTERSWTAAAIAHGGASNPARNADGPRRAVDAALAALAGGADPVDAAVAGVVVLEDDPRFNAGTGSRVRLDGNTVQMDASLMTSEGRFAAIGVVERVRNPIRVARALLDTPHLFLAGDGATRFARTLGMPDYDPATPEMKAKAVEIQRRLRVADPSLPARWRTFDWRTHWNFETGIAQAFAEPAAPRSATPGPAHAPVPADIPGASDPATTPGTDTVGVAVRARDGRFAVALSTGGTSITLHGRVGDVPVYGAGLWAGPSGAIAATGEGERIIEAGLAREMHRWMENGATADEAAKRAVAMLREKGSIGVIVIDPSSMAADCDQEMAWAAREADSPVWLGPVPGPLR